MLSILTYNSIIVIKLGVSLSFLTYDTIGSKIDFLIMSYLVIRLILYVHLCRSINIEKNTNIIIICKQLKNDDFCVMSLL